MYLPDTDTCSFFMRNESDELCNKFVENINDMVLSQIVIAELRYGAENAQHKKAKILPLIEDMVAKLEVQSWDASTEYGILRAKLQKSGRNGGGNDLLIAAHAMKLDLVLVTRNLKHFEHIEGLKYENWYE